MKPTESAIPERRPPPPQGGSNDDIKTLLLGLRQAETRLPLPSSAPPVPVVQVQRYLNITPKNLPAHTPSTQYCYQGETEQGKRKPTLAEYYIRMVIRRHNPCPPSLPQPMFPKVAPYCCFTPPHLRNPGDRSITRVMYSPELCVTTPFSLPPPSAHPSSSTNPSTAWKAPLRLERPNPLQILTLKP